MNNTPHQEAFGRLAVSSVAVITKTGNARAAALGSEIAAWLEGRGMPCRVIEHRPEQDCCAVSGETDLAMVLGGDGTLLSVARTLAGGGPPLVGVNLGRLGHLAQVPADGWQEFLEQTLDHGLSVVERLVLAWSVGREGTITARGRVLNDVVVNRGTLARLIRLGLALNGRSLGTLRADGLIVATPTGSTAYSVSAGGPVIHPDMDAFSVTAICPFFQDFRPLVLPGRAVLEVTVEEDSAEVHLTLDGQSGVALEQGDVICIERAESGVRMARVGRALVLPKLKLP